MTEGELNIHDVIFELEKELLLLIETHGPNSRRVRAVITRLHALKAERRAKVAR